MSFDPILVPFDGSEPAQAAAALSRVLAARTGARVALLHAVPNTGALGVRVTLAAHADELLTEEARLFDTPVEARVVDGVPASAMAAEAERAALVIMGTRGRSRVAGVLLGSVTRYLLRSVTPPVLVLHGPLPVITRIVVGVDASASAVATVRAARTLADATGARLSLVHVVTADPEVVRRPEAFGVPDTVWQEAISAHQEGVFRPLRAIAGAADERIAFGLPTERLRAIAAEEGAQVIAVGRKGDSGRDVDAWLSVAFGLAVHGPHATLVV